MIYISNFNLYIDLSNNAFALIDVVKPTLYPH